MHLSDLHFGRIDPKTLDPLVRASEELSPDVVAVSGDLTQRARPEQFRAAAEFLGRIPGHKIVVPGNHDVPLYNLLSRFLRPLAVYRQYITSDLTPSFSDSEVAIMGVVTARSFAFKNGRINADQVATIRGFFRSAARAGALKAVVMHHPVELPFAHRVRDRVGRAALALEALLDDRVDLLLAGHMHLASSAPTAVRGGSTGRQTVIVQAGTATSTRGRGEPNSFNSIDADRNRITVRQYIYAPATGRFVDGGTQRFHRVSTGWALSDDRAAEEPA